MTRHTFNIFAFFLLSLSFAVLFISVVGCSSQDTSSNQGSGSNSTRAPYYSRGGDSNQSTYSRRDTGSNQGSMAPYNSQDGGSTYPDVSQSTSQDTSSTQGTSPTQAASSSQGMSDNPPGNTECEFGYKHNEERRKIPSCMTECLKKFSADICQKLNAGSTNRQRSVHACKQGEDYFVGCHTVMVGRYWKFHTYYNHQLKKQIRTWKQNYCEAKHITLYPCNSNEMPETPPSCGYQCRKCTYIGNWYEKYQCVEQCNQCREQHFFGSDDDGSQQ